MCGCIITFSHSKPGELTESEAHRIGVEWAQEVFGDKFQVLISTHTDKGHYHNHFVVCPYDDDGKLWRADKKSLNRCKAISDRIALKHHISIIERPKKTYNHKYGDYLSRQRRNSWKENLKAELDELVMRDDVCSIDDLTEKLKEKGYGVNLSYLQMQGRTLDMGEYRGFKLSIFFDTLTKYVIQI